MDLELMLIASWERRSGIQREHAVGPGIESSFGKDPASETQLDDVGTRIASEMSITQLKSVHAALQALIHRPTHQPALVKHTHVKTILCSPVVLDRDEEVDGLPRTEPDKLGFKVDNPCPGHDLPRCER